jgi:hypothetical protein
MKTTAISIRYATLKAVKKFFGTNASMIAFPTEFDTTDEDEAKFLRRVKNLPNIVPTQKGERIDKPTFTFGRVLLKMSKNAINYSFAECTIYIKEYDYDLGGGKSEKRVQIVIAPPATADEDDTDEDINDLSWLGAKPQIADDDDDDTDDTDDDNE